MATLGMKLTEVLDKSLRSIGFSCKGRYIASRSVIDTDSVRVVNVGRPDGNRIVVVAEDLDGMFWIEVAAKKVI